MFYMKTLNIILEELSSLISRYTKLPCEQINHRARFLEMGVDSLVLTRVVYEIEKTYKIKLSIKILFERLNNLYALAEYITKNITQKIDNNSQGNSWLANKKIQQSKPLSQKQRQLWVFSQMGENDSGSIAYNININLQLEGVLNYALMKQAIQSVVDRYDALRSTIGLDGMTQKILPFFQIDFPIIDFSVNDKNTQKAVVDNWILEYNKQAFNFIESPSFLARLIKLADNLFILVLKFHHIFIDGIALELILEEIAELYSAGCEARFPNLLLPFNLFANDEQYYKKERILNLSYWVNNLSGHIPPCKLPYDFSRPNTRVHTGNNRQVLIPNALYDKLKALGLQNNATLYMVLFAFYSSFLYKISGTHDITIVTPTSGRYTEDMQRIIGYYAGMLPIRTKIDYEDTFFTYLQKTVTAVTSSLDHQNFSFSELCANLNLGDIKQPNATSFPLSPILLNKLTFTFSFSALTAALYLSPYVNYVDRDLLFNFIVVNNQLILDFQFSTQLFKNETAEKISELFLTYISQVIVDPGKKIDDFTVNVNSANKIIVNADNPTLVRFFEQQANKNPNNVAIIFKNQQLTYKELNEKANQWARFLRKTYSLITGVTFAPDTLIAIRIDRSLEMIVGILAILKAGGAYVPIDISNPETRARFILEDTGVKLLLTKSSLEQDVNYSKVTPIVMDKQILNEDQCNLDIKISSQDLAYVIYTSGTSGKPKGVLQTHYNVCRLFTVTDKYFQFNDKDTWILFHSFAFDFSVWEIWGALLYGGKCIIPSFNETRDPELLSNLLSQHKVTILNQTPSAFRQLMSLTQTSQLFLRWIIFGGEVLNIQELAVWWERYPADMTKLVNMYGITETTVHVTYKELRKTDLQLSYVSDIGKKLDDMTAYVLSESLTSVAVGVPGELYIGGNGLARGYLNMPELTSAKFIANPFVSEVDKKNGFNLRLYKTGDLVKWLPNGNLAYLGRNDQQIKIRGFRIEIGEIEYALASYAEISQSIVRVYENNNQKQIVGYYIAEKEMDVEQLRQHLLGYIPDYMVPAYFIKLSVFPLNANGKVDDNKLPRPDFSYMIIKDCDQPKKRIEKIIAKAWQTVLGLEKIGKNVNFFSVGGDSIKSVQIIMELKKAGYTISLKDFFSAGTIANSAFKIVKINQQTPSNSLPNISNKHLSSPVNAIDVFPSSMMQRLMINDYLKYKNGAYHFVQCFFLRNVSIKKNFITKVLADTVQNTNAFKTYFSKTLSGDILQVVRREVDFQPEYYYFTSNQDIEHELINMINQDQALLFNVYDSNSLLIRVKIVFVGNQDCILYISMHHSIIDGWSNIIFINKLFSKLIGNGDCKNYSKQNNSFKQYCLHEQSIVNNKKMRHFWRWMLQKNTEPFLSKLPQSANNANRLQVKLSRQFSGFIEQLMQQKQVSLKTLFLHSFFHVLQSFFGQDNITIGVITNTRQDDVSDPTAAFGMFWNIAPIFFNTCSNDIFKLQKLLNLIDSFYGRYPLPKIIADLQKTNLFNVTFKYIHFHHMEIDHTGIADRYLIRDLYAYPLNLTVLRNNKDACFYLSIDYMSEYFTLATLDALISKYVTEIIKCYSCEYSVASVIIKEKSDLML